MYAASLGEMRLAFDILRRVNPMSSGCGRFCNHPCEQACNRGDLDQPLAIREIERFISDEGRRQGAQGCRG